MGQGFPPRPLEVVVVVIFLLKVRTLHLVGFDVGLVHIADAADVVPEDNVRRPVVALPHSDEGAVAGAVVKQRAVAVEVADHGRRRVVDAVDVHEAAGGVRREVVDAGDGRGEVGRQAEREPRDDLAPEEVDRKKPMAPATIATVIVTATMTVRSDTVNIFGSYFFVGFRLSGVGLKLCFVCLKVGG